MKKKVTARPAKATSRQSTLNFPTSSEADLVAESAAAETSTKSGVKNGRKRTADFADDADKHTESHCDSSAISAQSVVKTKSRREGTRITVGRPSWSNLPLSDVVHSIDQGWSPRCENYAASSHSEWAVIKTTAIQNLQFLDQENKVLPSTLEPRKHLELRPGDLLITRAGPRNRVGVACLVRSTRPRLMLCDKAYRLKCRLDVVEPAFLELALNSPDLVSQVNKLKTGINDSGVNITQTPFMNLEIPVPTIAEQHRIVAEIEKQFTRLDAGVAALKRVQANLKRYRAAVLKAACEGKLVPTEAELARQEGRTYETGEQLLNRILAHRKLVFEQEKVRGSKKNYTEPSEIEPGLLPTISEGWTLASAEAVCSSVRDGTHDTPSYVQAGVPLITSKNLLSNGLDFENVKLISPEVHIEIGKRSGVERGDILFAMIGTIGNPVVVETDAEFSIKNVGLFKSNAEFFLPRYLRYWFMSPNFTRWLEPKQKGTTQKFVPLGLLRALVVALPPLAEQTRIVAEVERRLSVVDELEAVVSANLQRANRLRQSILQKAFTGELTGDGTCLRDSQASVERVVSRQAAGVAVSPTPAARR